MTAAIAEQTNGGMTGHRRPAADYPDEASATDVLLIDGYELLEPLDRWFREDLVPSRPEASVTVVAGRAAPPPGWWVDPGWRRLVRVHELRAFDSADSDELLTRLGVQGENRAAMARLARGHPLVLAMLAEAGQTDTVPSQLADVPDVVGQPHRMITDDVPDAAHRTGLATCAHATRMTEDLLACAKAGCCPCRKGHPRTPAGSST